MADQDRGGTGLPGPAGLRGLLGDALRDGVVDDAAERRAVAAFRAARDSGTRSGRTRSRDDWRPGGGRGR
ncbi:hypothetical protein ACGFY7_14420 [Streptomyces prunicolor]|uniref:hypothetical protein n=1 Tax=Streptomyces prunicolor TaxID=67348 RepID=UPI00371353C1